MFARKSLTLLFCLFSAAGARAATSSIEFTSETLDNGLRVIYAPMHNAPVVQVRVLYHVGSRDERQDRQGFAHMFEHMMFRGSAHVAPEEHMKLIGTVGGDSNAFTSFDQTTYHNTLPSSNLEMAMYLEADRMASFKVNADILRTERMVVAQEWLLRTANPPLGTIFQDVFKTAFNTHSYNWTPIGNMDQLKMSEAGELQAFFNTYYVPNNACLIICGDIDVENTKQLARKYYGWIPRGPDIVRTAKPEPEQTETRRLVVNKPNVSLTTIYMGFKTPNYRSDDQDALGILGDILSGGRTGRLDRQLVYSANPKCVSVGAGSYQLEDPSLFVVNATIQNGVDPAEVEKDILAGIQEVIEKGVTQEELDKIKTQQRKAIISSRETAASVAQQLGEEEVFGGDANRVNTAFARLDAITVADIQRVAKTYLKQSAMTVVQYQRGTPATQPAIAPAQIAAAAAASQPADEKVTPRVSSFPENYPTTPPINREPKAITFNKGVESDVDGVKVITLTDNRLPLVSFTLVMKGGSDAERAGKQGLASLTAQMLRRGSDGAPFLELSAELESRGISIDAVDDGDITRLNVSCTADQLDYAVQKAALILTKPTFPEEELTKLKKQTAAALTQSLNESTTVATRNLKQAIYGDTALGRLTTPESVGGVSRDDVLAWYDSVYSADGAFIVLSGDITPEKGADVTRSLLMNFKQKPELAEANYNLPEAKPGRRIILVDNPSAKQATIRYGLRAYDVRNDDRFAGAIAGQILSSGIDSRLNKYVRAEKGLTYGTYAYFRPSRHGGEFSGTLDTNINTAAAAIEATFEVFGKMRDANVTDTELTDAKLRVAGGMAMEVQTASQQASRRVTQILNGFPVDYYDHYPEYIGKVTADQVRDVMSKYAKDDQMTIVVVAPVAEVKEQLEKLGTVEIVSMPLKEKEAK